MDRPSSGSLLNALDGLECGARSIFHAGRGILRLPYAPRSEDAGAACLVGETDEVGVRQPVLQGGQLGALAVSQLQCRLGVAPGVLRHRGLLRSFADGLHLDLVGPGVGYEAGGQHNQVHLDSNVVAQQRIVDRNGELAAVRRDALDVAFCQEYPRLFLNPLVEVLVLSRGPHVSVEYVRFRLGALLRDVERLLQRCHAADGRAIGQVLRISLARALDERYFLDFFAVRWPGDLAGLGQFLHLEVGDYVRGLAVSQMIELGSIVGLESGGLHNGAGLEGLPVLQGDIVHSGRTCCLLDLGTGEDLDLRVPLDLLDPVFQSGVLQVAVGGSLRVELVQLVQHAAQRGLLLHEAHFVARLGRFDGRCHPGDAAAHHQHGLVYLGLERLGDLGLAGPGTAHAQVVLGQHLGVFVVRRMAPDYVLSDIHALEEDGRVVSENVHLDTRRAGGDDYSVDALTRDVGLDQGCTLLAAKEGVGLAHRCLPVFGPHAAEGVNVDRFPYTAAAAYVDSDLLSHLFLQLRRIGSP